MNQQIKTTMKQYLTAWMSLALAFVTPSHAADPPEHHLPEWKLGNVLFGEEVDKDALSGKVVVIEHWGVNCPPCIALLPHLAKLDKRHREDGLVIIGAESQGHGKNQIEPLVKKNKIEYTITSGANGPVKFSGIPHAFVFDVEGKLIFNGHPGDDDFERILKRALKDIGEPIEEDEVMTGNLFESQSWTNTEGIEIKAAVKTATIETVTFLLPQGKVVNYPMNQLSEASRKLITDALAEKETDSK